MTDLLQRAKIAEDCNQVMDNVDPRDIIAMANKWQTMETAPKDRDILVWYDHDQDPYQDPDQPDMITDYACWAEGVGALYGKGYCIAKWQPQFWESVDEYGGGYWMPAWWFALENDDYERAVFPVFWKELEQVPSYGEANGYATGQNLYEDLAHDGRPTSLTWDCPLKDPTCTQNCGAYHCGN